MLLCPKIDLDLEDPGEVYVNAKETVSYLNDVIKTIESRLKKGEEFDGLYLAPGRKRRVITDKGVKFLEKKFGHDKVYKVKESPITITDLEKMLEPDEMTAMFQKGFLAYKEGPKKVKATKKRKERE